MLLRRNMTICGIIVFLFIFLAPSVSIHAADTTSQIISNIDEILKDNPLKAGEKFQLINIAQDDTVTLSVLRVAEGAVIKQHLHKTHDETVYVIKGTGQMFINGKWVDIKPGSLHFNPMNKVHATKNTGTEPLIAVSVFTPAMKTPDRHFVE
jgi:quercetin dioxygenase-like cupin family protein